MSVKTFYTKEASQYWDEQYSVHGYKVVHDAGTEKKTFDLATRELDFFLWPTKSKSSSLLRDKENNPWPTFDEGFVERHKSIDEYFDKLDDKLALDYGCGILGRYTFALSKYFKTVYGVDIAANAIRGCVERKKDLDSKNTIFHLCDGLHIKLPNNFIDFIFSNLVLQHIGYKEGIFEILREFARILKPDGVARLEFLDSSQKRSEGFFSVVEGCGMNIEEIREEVQKCNVYIDTRSECKDYLWITMKKKR